MASKLSLTRTAPPRLALAPGAAAAPPSPAGDVAATGDVTDLQRLRLAAGPPLIPGPALTPVATDAPPAVAVTTTRDMAVDAIAAPRHAATGPALTPTAARPPQTGTRVAETAGPAPGLPPVKADAGGWRARSAAGRPDPHPEPTGAGQSLNLRAALSV